MKTSLVELGYLLSKAICITLYLRSSQINTVSLNIHDCLRSLLYPLTGGPEESFCLELPLKGLFWRMITSILKCNVFCVVLSCDQMAIGGVLWQQCKK